MDTQATPQQPISEPTQQREVKEKTLPTVPEIILSSDPDHNERLSRAYTEIYFPAVGQLLPGMWQS